MKNSYDGWIAALDNADDAALAAAVGFGRFHFHQHLVALHGVVDFAWRNKYVFTDLLLRIGPHNP